MKAQVTIEFIISIVIFLITVSYVSFIIINIMPSYHNIAYNEIVKSKTYQISEFLMFENLSSGEFYKLDDKKISLLNSMCETNYEEFKKGLGLNSSDVIIRVESFDKIITECGSYSQARPYFFLHRIALNSSNDILKLTVGVMK